jgi:hypothetical protein
MVSGYMLQLVRCFSKYQLCCSPCLWDCPPGRLERLAIYIAGLILLDRDQTTCRICCFLPGRRELIRVSTLKDNAGVRCQGAPVPAEPLRLQALPSRLAEGIPHSVARLRFQMGMTIRGVYAPLCLPV